MTNPGMVHEKLLQKQGSSRDIQIPANVFQSNSEVTGKYTSHQHNKGSEKNE